MQFGFYGVCLCYWAAELLSSHRRQSFGAFEIFGNLVSRKRMVVERNGLKFGPQGKVISCSRSSSGHSVYSSPFSFLFIYFSISTTLYLKNVWSYNKTDQTLTVPYVYVLSVYKLPLTVKCSRSCWGHIVYMYLRFPQPYISKTAGCRVKLTKTLDLVAA